MNNQEIKSDIDIIEYHLLKAFEQAKLVQIKVQNSNGDSEVFRKFAFYLTPSLNHWLNGKQAGSIADLKDTLK